jgi:hypothetical protein
MPLDHSHDTAEYPYPLEMVYEAALASAKQMRGMTLRREDRIAGRLELYASASALSWGDRVTISMSSVGPTRTHVSVSSAAKTGVMLGGWMSGSKQQKNTLVVLNAISSQFSRQALYRSQAEYEQEAPKWDAAGWTPISPTIDKAGRVSVRWDRRAPAASDTPAGSSPPNGRSAASTVAEAIDQIAQLREQGLLTAEEYAAKNAELLARL